MQCLFVYLSAEGISRYIQVKFEATFFCSRFLTDTEMGFIAARLCRLLSLCFLNHCTFSHSSLHPSHPALVSILPHTAKGNFNSELLTRINSKIILGCQLINKTTHRHGSLHLHQWLLYFCAAEKTLQSRRQPKFPLLLRLNATHSWIYLHLPLL